MTTTSRMMDPLDLVKLTGLMRRSSGRTEIRVGLIDGPVAIAHPDLVSENIQEIPGRISGTCARANTAACKHGTFVAGMFCAKRGSIAPAICPDCTLLVRPIFAETERGNGEMPSATPEQLTEAVTDCVNAGVHVINLSAALTHASTRGERELEEALNYAAQRGAILVAAAGNQGTVGSSAITRHPAVIPVTGCDLQGRLLVESNLGDSIGRRGLSAPGENITSLGTNGKAQIFGGTSAAAPFVSGTVALLWSEFPNASTTQIKLALTQAYTRRRRTIAPPMLDASAAYESLKSFTLGV